MSASWLIFITDACIFRSRSCSPFRCLVILIIRAQSKVIRFDPLRKGFLLVSQKKKLLLKLVRLCNIIEMTRVSANHHRLWYISDLNTLPPLCFSPFILFIQFNETGWMDQPIIGIGHIIFWSHHNVSFYQEHMLPCTKHESTFSCVVYCCCRCAGVTSKTNSLNK